MKMNARIFSNYCIAEGKNPLLSSVLNIKQKAGMSSLADNDGPLADAILDRIVHDAYKINIESIDPSKDISMREVYGLDKSLSE
jgi:hypothetical protein